MYKFNIVQAVRHSELNLSENQNNEVAQYEGAGYTHIDTYKGKVFFLDEITGERFSLLPKGDTFQVNYY